MIDVHELIKRASAAGLTIQRGPFNRLKIRGPRDAESLAMQLLEHKAEVLKLICWPHGPFDIQAALHGDRWTCKTCGRFYGYDPRRQPPAERN